MGANNYILALYAVSAIMAFACALIPGSGLLGRLSCVLAGFALTLWPASTFVLTGWYDFGIAIAAVPPILLIYGLVTVRRYFTRTTWVPGVGAVGVVATSERTFERRAPGRRVLPGEFGDVPVNQPPESHDPWEALYAADERQRLRADPSSALARLAFDTQPPWYLENIDEVSRRDAPHAR